MAETREEQQRRRRRKRLTRGLLLGGVAVGVPALFNAMVSRRAAQLPAATWGSGDRYLWDDSGTGGSGEGGEIVFQRLGDGQPIVFLHSFGPGHSNMEWRRSAEILASEYQVIAPDLLGWGASDRPQRTYDGALYIRLLGDFLRDVVGQPAVIAAAGLSASYALRLAEEQPQKVRALALVGPRGVRDSAGDPELKDVVVHKMLRLPVLGTSALNLYTSRSAIAGYLEREVYGSAAAVDETAIDEYYRSSHLPGGHAALAAAIGGSLHHGVSDLLGRLNLPIWLGWGRRTVHPSIEMADLWLRHLDAELEVFEQCGMLPHAESPEEFCRKLQRFLLSLHS